MEENRKLAVSFGSFACVIEGSDQPFILMRKVVNFFRELSEQDPDFGGFSEISDFQALKEVLEKAEKAEVELEPIAGGVYVRRLLAPAETVEPLAVPTAELESHDPEPVEPQVEAVTEPQSYEAEPVDDPIEEIPTAPEYSPDLALVGDDAPAEVEAEAAEDQGTDAEEPLTIFSGALSSDTVDEAAPASDMDDAADPIADFDVGQAMDQALVDTDPEPETPAFEPEMVETEPAFDPAPVEETPVEMVEAQPAAEPVFETPLETPDEEPAPEMAEAFAEAEPAPPADVPEPEAVVPLEAEQPAEPVQDLGGEAIPESPAAPPEETPAPAAAMAEPDAGETRRPFLRKRFFKDAGEPPEAPAAAEKPAAAEGAAPLSLSSDEFVLAKDDTPAAADASEEAKEDAPAEAAPMRLTLDAPMRLGAEPDDAPEAPPAASEFIDRVVEQPETQSLLRLNRKQRGAAPSEGVVKREVETQLQQTPDEPPAKTDEAEGRGIGGLRVGGFLRKKKSGDEAPASEADKDEGRALKLAANDGDSAATKPGAAAGGGGLASGLLRVIKSDDADAKPTVAETPAPAPAPQPEPQPEPVARPAKAAPPERPAPAASGKGGDAADPLKDRLHASFAARPEPGSAKAGFTLEEATGDEDATTAKGFAQRVGAKSVPELMSAATAYLLIIDARAVVTRAEIMETVQSVMGDTPLTAEAKVKAFGKLVRSGTLVRLDGGEFTMTPEALEDYQARLESAPEEV